MSTPERIDDTCQPVPPLTAEEYVEARAIHPDARALFSVLPFLRYVPNFGASAEAFGPKCVVAVGQAEFLCKGIADYIIYFSMYPMFINRYQINAMEYQRMKSMRSMGWSVKAFAAMFSDIFSLFGYTKRWYLATSCVVGATFALGYGILPPVPSSAPIAGAFVFFTSFTKANVDILTQGHYSRLLRRVPAAGPSLVSWVWGWVLMGSLIASVIVGPLADAHLEQTGVFISASLQFVTTIFFVFNWYGERRNREDRAEDRKIALEKLLEDEEAGRTKLQGDGMGTPGALVVAGEGNELLGLPSTAPFSTAGNGRMGDEGTDAKTLSLPSCCFGAFEVNAEVARRNWRVVLYCILMTMGSVAMVIATLLGDKWQLLYACGSISVFLCGFGFFALRPVIAKANLYKFLSTMLYIQLPGALDSFFLAGPDCLPDGPQFTFFFYNTIANIIGSAFGIVGVTLFKYVFSKRSYRLTFIVTTTVQVVASIFDLIMVERWHRPYINDHVMYVLGDQIVYEVCYQLRFMPPIILISRLCPRGSESMVYALLAGFSNFGRSVSNSLGSLMMEFLWPVQSDPNVGPCDFSNVKWLLLVGHFLCPLLSIPLVFFLIPAARICDDIDLDGKIIQPSESTDTSDGNSHAPQHGVVVGGRDCGENSPRSREPARK